jgi:hypothetical protein
MPWRRSSPRGRNFLSHDIPSVMSWWGGGYDDEAVELWTAVWCCGGDARRVAGCGSQTHVQLMSRCTCALARVEYSDLDN